MGIVDLSEGQGVVHGWCRLCFLLRGAWMADFRGISWVGEFVLRIWLVWLALGQWIDQSLRADYDDPWRFS
jgi:hypothetical protein